MENNIGNARREYAERIGKFTQEDAAEFFGVSLSTYKKWEQGQGMMNGNQLRSIAEKYGVTVDYLLQITPPKPTGKPAAALAPGERRLVDAYRAMSDEGRDKLLDYAAYLQSRHPLNTGVSRSA